MDHRDRAAPIALARNAPVAQPEIDLAFGHRPIVTRYLLEPACDLRLRLFDAHAVKKARIDYAPVAVVGGIGDDEGAGVLTRRTDHRRVAEAVLVGEVEVALVVCGAAEDRAGAVVHDDEIGDVDRKPPTAIEGMDSLHPGVETLLLRGIDQLLRGAVAFALGDEASWAGGFVREGGSQRRGR